ncbi:MAG: hypothetical protein V6D39_14860 [Dolichospermum lemmermannii FEM_B0920]|jgi:hypothetical protein
MSFIRNEFISDSHKEEYYPNENAKIRGLAKAELLTLLQDEEFLKSFKEKLKAEIKAEILSEIKGNDQ